MSLFAHANGSQKQPGCLPDEDGSNSWRPWRSHSNPWWHNSMWKGWWCSWQEHAGLASMSSWERTHFQQQEVFHHSVSFFEVRFSKDGMSPDPQKVQGFKDMPPPEDVTQLRSFLGAVNFMHPFIPHLSTNTPIESPPWEECNLPVDTYNKHSIWEVEMQNRSLSSSTIETSLSWSRQMLAKQD